MAGGRECTKVLTALSQSARFWVGGPNIDEFLQVRTMYIVHVVHVIAYGVPSVFAGCGGRGLPTCYTLSLHVYT